MIKKIFLVHHTHMDIGYTDLPIEVLDQHLAHLDEAVSLCREHGSFYWTIESAYLIRDYFRNRSRQHCNELIKTLQNGRMELQAFETQPLTELLSAREFFRGIEYSLKLGREYGVKVKSAMINDIGGYAGRLPSVLEHYGIKYLTAGAGGFQVHLPWADLPHLFYLQARDGARTLIWNLGLDRSVLPQDMDSLHAVYGQAANSLILPAIKKYLNIYERGVEIDFKSTEGNRLNAENIFAGFLERLEREKYPYEEIMLQYGGDNRGPAGFLPELLGKLNSSGKFPEIELTTPSRFFEYMEDKYIIPQIEGIIADPWNIRANPAPVSLKKYRAAQRTYHGALGRLALNDRVDDSYLDNICSTVEENLQLYGDHTCGLSEWGWQDKFGADGCRAEAYDRYRESWKAKAFYADAAKSGALELDRAVKNRLSSDLSGTRNVIIWNDAPRKISGNAEIYLGRDTLPLAGLKDENGGEVIFQETAANSYLIAADSVPPFGAKILYPEFAGYPRDFNFVRLPVPGSFKNDYFSATFNSRGDLISLLDRFSGRELLDRKAKWKFGDFIVQRIDDLPGDSRLAGMKVSKESYYLQSEITDNFLSMNGPLVTAITQKSKVPTDAGFIRYERTLYFYPGSPRIDVRIRVDKPETEKKESCYVAFPFAGTCGSFKFDQNIGLVDPGKDLLPGSMLDLFYCSRFCALDAGDFCAVIITPDAPLVQFGGIQTAQWLQEFPFKPENNHIYGQIYHNLLNTDCPAWQDVLETFEYSVWFQKGKFDYSSAQNSCYCSTSLSASFSSSHSVASAVSKTLEVSPGTVRLLSAGKAGKKCELFLENTASEAVTAKIGYKNRIQMFPMKAFEIAVVKI